MRFILLFLISSPLFLSGQSTTFKNPFKPRPKSGIVIKKVYEKENFRTVTNPTKVGKVNVSKSFKKKDDEDFILVIETKSGKSVKIYTVENVWLKYKKGDMWTKTVKCKYYD